MSKHPGPKRPRDNRPPKRDPEPPFDDKKTPTPKKPAVRGLTAEERAEIRAAARSLVADWPPLTLEQRERIAEIFAAGSKPTRRAA